MVSNSPEWNDDICESPAFAPIDDLGRQIIVLLWKKGKWDIETTPFTNLRTLSIRLVDIPQAGTASHLAGDQEHEPKDQVMIEIQDNSNPEKPLKYSFLNNISLWKNPYFNTVNLTTSDRYSVGRKEQYMPLLDRAIEELKQWRNSGAKKN